MDCCLVLTALSGVTINVSLTIAKFDRFEDLDVSVTVLKVFGCSFDFFASGHTDPYREPDLGQAATEHGIPRRAQQPWKAPSSELKTEKGNLTICSC